MAHGAHCTAGMNAIQKFRSDVQKLHQAQQVRNRDRQSLNTAGATLKTDTRDQKRDEDLFTKDRAQLKTDRNTLSGLRDQMDGFQQQAAQLQQQLTTNPLDANAQMALGAVQQKEAALQPQLDAATTAAATLRTQTMAQQAQVKTDGVDVKRDTRAVKNDTQVLDRARSRVHDAYWRAKGDLPAAEYKMNLKSTNAARKQLGLRPVNHVIRPGQISPQGQAQMKRLEQIAQGYAGGQRPMGWCLKKVEDYLQETSYGKIGHGNIPRFEYAHDFADYLNAGQRYKSLGLQKLNIDNPYQAPPGSIIVVRAGTPGTANPVAGDIVVKGYGDHFYNDGEMGYGGPGNFPKGNSYVLGIYAPQ
jgi:hypothetical protein